MRPPKQASAKRVILSGVLLACILFSNLLIPGHAARPSKRQLKEKRAKIQHNIRSVRQQLRQVKIQEKQKRVQLDSAEHRVRVARGQLHAATLRLRRAKLELRNANGDYQKAVASFAGTQDKASERIVATYERGEEGYLGFLLSASNFADLLERIQLAKFLQEQDRAALDDLKQRKDDIARYRQRVQGKTAEVSTWRKQVSIWHQRTVVEQYNATAKLHQVKDQREEIEAEYAELMRESAAIADMLRQMQTTPAGRRRYNRTYAGPVGGLPTRGRITSRFGWRVHPITGRRKLHTGVDIAAPMGTPIIAAGGGEVVYAGRRGGYGNAVIVDHGRGKSTLYAHMSAINARNGQVVRRGQVIGWVGSTGFSTGPHLHYEVRMNGAPVNPL